MWVTATGNTQRALAPKSESDLLDGILQKCIFSKKVMNVKSIKLPVLKEWFLKLKTLRPSINNVVEPQESESGDYCKKLLERMKTTIFGKRNPSQAEKNGLITLQWMSEPLDALCQVWLKDEPKYVEKLQETGKKLTKKENFGLLQEIHFNRRETGGFLFGGQQSKKLVFGILLNDELDFFKSLLTCQQVDIGSEEWKQVCKVIDVNPGTISGNSISASSSNGSTSEGTGHADHQPGPDLAEKVKMLEQMFERVMSAVKDASSYDSFRSKLVERFVEG